MFFGKTCPYCQMFDPIFRQVGERYRDVANFVKADVEQFYHIAAALGVMGTPPRWPLLRAVRWRLRPAS